jgi:hypothetical protein
VSKKNKLEIFEKKNCDFYQKRKTDEFCDNLNWKNYPKILKKEKSYKL